MCGIASIYNFDGRPVDVDPIASMCSAMAHRGPDGAGYALVQPHIALAHVRLSILDLDGGAQPIFNEDWTVAVTCNGEIYDYLRHRRQLEAACHVFRTNSDSELVVHLYEQHGTDFLPLLNGEFAFVLWDGRNRILLAARDRVGVKPLFYHATPSRLLLASEAKAILALEDTQRALDREYFLTAGMGIVGSNTSAFEGIKSLKPGHFLIANDDGVQDERPYHRWFFSPDPSMSLEMAVESVGAAVETAVQRRLQADVPVNCYLSGGIDSTIICGLLAGQVSRLTAYHVAFPGSIFDEAAQAAQTARHFGAAFEMVECTEATLLDRLGDTVESVEFPLANCNSVGKFVLSSLVQSHGHKVCLTGEGADEAFGGYAYFKLEALWRALQENRLTEAEFQTLWRKFQANEQRSVGVLWHKTNAWRRPSPYGYASYFFIRAAQGGIAAPFLFASDPGRSSADRFLDLFPPDDMKKHDPFNATRVMALDALAGTLIPTLGDRVEMAHSVECRTPFLDPELLNLTTRIPPEHFIDVPGLREKRLLHTAFADRLPQHVLRAHKHPFMSPRWRSLLSKGRGRELLGEYLSPESIRRVGLYSPRTIAALQAIWRYGPESSATVHRLDPLIGLLLTTHILHDRLVRTRYRSGVEVRPTDLSRRQ